MKCMNEANTAWKELNKDYNDLSELSWDELSNQFTELANAVDKCKKLMPPSISENNLKLEEAEVTGPLDYMRCAYHANKAWKELKADYGDWKDLSKEELFNQFTEVKTAYDDCMKLMPNSISEMY